MKIYNTIHIVYNLKKKYKIEVMGKCKRRTLYKANTSFFMTREEAINNVFKNIIKKINPDYRNVANTISLFGISAEELSERGLSYENLRALGSLIS